MNEYRQGIEIAIEYLSTEIERRMMIYNFLVKYNLESERVKAEPWAFSVRELRSAKAVLESLLETKNDRT